MAVMGLSDISSVLNLIFGAAITEQFRRDTILPNILPVKQEANGTCLWDVKIAARTTAGPRAQGADASGSDYSSDTKVQASLTWAHYEAFASITGTADRIAKANGRAGGQDILGQELQDAADELSVKISQHCYSGNVGNSPVEVEGLARAVDSTGTYAGLAQGTYADWASGENTHALASISKDAIRTKLLRPFKDNTGKRPPLVLCPGNVYDAVVGLFEESARIFVTTVQTPMGPVDIGKMGFQGVMLDGVPFLEDRHCTANTMYAIDPAYTELVQVPPAWTSMDPGQLQGLLKMLTGKEVAVDEIKAAMKAATSRLSAQVNALAKTGDSTKLQLVLDLQLRVRRRNAAAKLAFT